MKLDPSNRREQSAPFIFLLMRLGCSLCLNDFIPPPAPGYTAGLRETPGVAG